MPSLVIQPPDAEQRFFPLGQHRVVLIGRDDQCTIQLLDEQVSRRHLQIRFEDDDQRHYVHDYESANGVSVNGIRIKNDVALVDGDRIRAGGTTIVYLLGDHDDITKATQALRKMDEWKRGTLQVEGE